MPPRSTASDSLMVSQFDLLNALGFVPFVSEGSHGFRSLATVPTAICARFPALANPTIDLGAEFPFLADFLLDAAPLWQAGESTTLKSGPWTQPDANDVPCVLEATAVVQGRSGRRILLLEFLGAEFAELQELLQNAREQRLAFENLSKVHNTLAASARQLQRMAEERKAAIEMLRRTRDELEDRVAERTVALVEANERLRQEVVERARMNTELLQHQEQMRGLAEQLVVAEESERRQVAEFIHDRIGQSLALMKMRLRELEGAGPATPPALAEIHQLVEEVISDTRGLTSDLGTPVLYELGLTEALDNLVRRFEQVHGIAARCEDDGRGKPLLDNARLFVYQAVRELLHNIVKHADASLVVVKTRREANNLVVSVADKGLGFDSKNHEFRVTSKGGFGLFNLRERAMHLGGKCEVHSVPGRGTEVLLTIPLAEVSEQTR